MGFIRTDKDIVPVAGGERIAAGDTVVINSSGCAEPAPAPGPGVSGTVFGVAIEDADNTAGNDGDVRVTIEFSRGQKEYLFAGSGIGLKDVTKPCYVGADPKAVSLTSEDAVLAGTISGVEADGRVRVILPL